MLNQWGDLPHTKKTKRIMNEKILNDFSGKCIELIQLWKKENWFKPLDVQKDCIIDHIVTYDDDAAELYHQLREGASDDDPEIRKELTKLENHLYEINKEKLI